MVAALTIIGILILAAAMSGLDSGAGYRVGSSAATGQTALLAARGHGLLLRLLAILALVSLIVALVNKRSRRWVLLVLLGTVGMALILTLIAPDQAAGTSLMQAQGEMQFDMMSHVDDRPIVDLETAVNRQIPPVLVYIASVAVISLLFAVVLHLLARRRSAPDRDPGLLHLANQAGQALAALDAGNLTWPDAISECYAAMQCLAASASGISRPLAMTPREYAVTVVRMGIPEDAAMTITMLYEAVHYGERPPSDQAVQTARTALASLAAVCPEKHR